MEHLIDIDRFPDDALLTTREVTTTLRLNYGTFRNLRRRGKAPRATRFGRSVRFRIADIRAWLEEQREANRP